MVTVWQYGSNMHEKRLNSSERLNGAAKFVGLAVKSGYKLAFTHTNKDGVGVSDIIESDPDDYVFGCLYEIPDSEIRKLDKIEGADSRAYKKVDNCRVTKLDEALNETSEKVKATTYVVVKKENNPRTNSNYANHILNGIKEHKMGIEYFVKVKEIILKNNPDVEKELICYSGC